MSAPYGSCEKIDIDDMCRSIAENKIKIFISYSRQDKEFVDEVVNCLSKLEIPLYVDKKLIKPWGNVTEYMALAIEADFFIPIVSNSYLRSINAMSEAISFIALNNHEVRIIPVVLEREVVFGSDSVPKYIEIWKKNAMSST